MLMVKTAGLGSFAGRALWGGVKRIPGAVNVGVNLAGKGVQGATYLGKKIFWDKSTPILGKFSPMTKGMLGFTAASTAPVIHSSATNAFANPGYARRIFMN